jgi:hypothetical protein
MFFWMLVMFQEGKPKWLMFAQNKDNGQST